jgi:hypothetical protein
MKYIYEFDYFTLDNTELIKICNLYNKLDKSKYHSYKRFSKEIEITDNIGNILKLKLSDNCKKFFTQMFLDNSPELPEEERKSDDDDYLWEKYGNASVIKKQLKINLSNLNKCLYELI